MPIVFDFCFDWDFLNAVATFCAVLVALFLGKPNQKIKLKVERIEDWDVSSRKPYISLKITAYNLGNSSVHLEKFGLYEVNNKRILDGFQLEKHSCTIEPRRNHSFKLDSFDFYSIISDHNFQGSIKVDFYVKIYTINSLGKRFFSYKMKIEDWYDLKYETFWAKQWNKFKRKPKPTKE